MIKLTVDITTSVNILLEGIEAQSKIRMTEPFQPQILRTTHNIKTTDSDKRSIGYETMTTLSDSDSRVCRVELQNVNRC